MSSRQKRTEIKVIDRDTKKVKVFKPDKNGIIHVPAGNYELLATFYLPSNMKVVGAKKV